MLEAAVKALPSDAARIFRRGLGTTRRAVIEPDRCNRVPEEGRKHYLNVEKTSTPYLEAFRRALARLAEPDAALPEEIQDISRSVDREYFAAAPPPFAAGEARRLWRRLPGDDAAFRDRFGPMISAIGTVVYEPARYTRALARAIGRSDRRRVNRYAGHLAHYVADLHVPFHVTANYKGQYSGAATRSGWHDGRANVHARFESAYVEHRLDRLRRRVLAAALRPRALPLAEVTPAAIEAGARAYARVGELLEADRQATGRVDPVEDWAGYVALVDRTFFPIAEAQLTEAAGMLANLLLSASRNPLAPSPGSSMMNAP